MSGKIAVLKGGWSPEREISLLSGKEIAKKFMSLGYEVAEIDVIKDLRFITNALYEANPDYIYVALHGIGGEDGVIQGLLEIFGKPYSHSGVLGSAVAFDKSVCKIIAQSCGILVPDGFEISKNDFKTLQYNDYPFVIKPCSNGSSIGVFVIHNEEELLKVQTNEWEFGNEIIVEKFIPGREFTIMIIDGVARGSLEVVPKHEFFDYASKYDDGGAYHVHKHGIPRDVTDMAHRAAEKIYKACRCSGVSRADFRYDGENMYFLEINSQPGMTEVSLCPDIASSSSISFEEMNCFWMRKKQGE
ncbi:MAG: D-alanine--D-alanine ligase [Holosporales bacterium]|jgi:D-alanine-D-alanine ligase|nr:D-alanine--D-alanine ligase [Holosporales bacterium]